MPDYEKRISEFGKALQAIGEYKKVTCVVDAGEPVIYQVKDDELTVNGKITDYRNFCFSPSQIFFGDWTVTP